MESTNPKFETWLAEHGFDQLHWTPELRKSLERRYRSEQAVKPDHQLLVDCRGADWPVKVYRQEVTL
jgi:hypothetical protein